MHVIKNYRNNCLQDLLIQKTFGPVKITEVTYFSSDLSCFSSLLKLSLSLSSHASLSLHTCVSLSSQLSSSLLFLSSLSLPSLLSDLDNDHLLSWGSLCTHSSLTLSARVQRPWPVRWWANCSLHAERICIFVYLFCGVCCVLCVVRCVWCVVCGVCGVAR